MYCTHSGTAGHNKIAMKKKNYLRLLHSSPVNPVLHPPRQLPLVCKHASDEIQAPQDLEHIGPYFPMSHATLGK